MDKRRILDPNSKETPANLLQRIGKDLTDQEYDGLRRLATLAPADKVLLDNSTLFGVKTLVKLEIPNGVEKYFALGQSGRVISVLPADRMPEMRLNEALDLETLVFYNFDQGLDPLSC